MPAFHPLFAIRLAGDGRKERTVGKRLNSEQSAQRSEPGQKLCLLCAELFVSQDALSVQLCQPSYLADDHLGQFGQPSGSAVKVRVIVHVRSSLRYRSGAGLYHITKREATAATPEFAFHPVLAVPGHDGGRCKLPVDNRPISRRWTMGNPAPKAAMGGANDGAPALLEFQCLTGHLLVISLITNEPAV